LLRLEVNRAGSQKKWAKKIGVTQPLISMVLSGNRPLNNKIISALKLRVVYERLNRTAARPSALTRRVGSPTGRGLPSAP
jgi:DNA-binding transcriptional regulator YdaS (Cro superfamily)